MIEIHLRGAELRLNVRREDGLRQMAFVDPQSGIRVRVDLPPEAAKEVADALAGSGIIAAGPADIAALGGV